MTVVWGLEPCSPNHRESRGFHEGDVENDAFGGDVENHFRIEPQKTIRATCKVALGQNGCHGSTCLSGAPGHDDPREGDADRR